MMHATLLTAWAMGTYLPHRIKSVFVVPEILILTLMTVYSPACRETGRPHRPSRKQRQNAA